MSHLWARTVFVCNVIVLILGRRLHVFGIDVIYFIINGGCNNVIVMVLMLIIADYSRCIYW